MLATNPRFTRLTKSGDTVAKACEWYAVASVLLVVSGFLFFGQGEATLTATGTLAQTANNPLKPSYYYVTTYAATLLLIIKERGQILSAKSVSPWLSIFFVVFIVLHLLWIPFAIQSDTVERMLVLRVNDAALSLCFMVVLSRIEKYEGLLNAVRLSVIATTIINFVVVFLPALIPIQTSSVPGRAAGLYWDPNECSILLALSLPLCCYALNARYRVLWYCIILLAILLTFSREGIILWATSSVLDFSFRPGSRQRREQSLSNGLILVGSATLLGLALLLAYSSLIGVLLPYTNADTLSRLNGTDEGSGNERLGLAMRALGLFADSPILGNGYGSAKELLGVGLSTHNLYLLMLVEFGLPGLLCLGLFFYGVYRIGGKLGGMLTLQVVVIGMFAHYIFDLAYYSFTILIYWRLGAEKNVVASSNGRPVMNRRQHLVPLPKPGQASA